MLTAAHGASGIQPSECFGEVAGGGTIEVPVTLHPAAEQSLRRNLAVLVEHGETAYVGVRAEVVQRKACLSLTQVNLGTSYVRVGVQRTITLTNLTNIATEFVWRSHVKRGSAKVAPARLGLSRRCAAWWRLPLVVGVWVRCAFASSRPLCTRERHPHRSSRAPLRR